jgi:propionyl-CoA carboxylase beta chain
MDRIELLKQKRAESQKGGGEKRIDSQHSKGKLTARERLHFLLDEGSFEEIGAFVTHRSVQFGLERQKFLGDGVVTVMEPLTVEWFTFTLKTLQFLVVH